MTRKFSSIRLIAGVFCALVTTQAASTSTLDDIKSKKEMRVGIQPGFMPFGVKRPDGSWAGFEVEMMKSFASSLGAKAVFVDAKFEGIIPALLVKKFDVVVSGMTITPERAQVVAFSDGYYDAGLTILLTKSQMGRIKSVEDANKAGIKLAVQVGTTGDFFGEKTFKKAMIVKFDLDSDAVNAVLLGKVDGFICDVPFADLFARHNKDRVGRIDAVMTKESFGLAARKSDGDLIQAFNGFLKKWRTSGEYARHLKSAFSDEAWASNTPRS